MEAIKALVGSQDSERRRNEGDEPKTDFWGVKQIFGQNERSGRLCPEPYRRWQVACSDTLI